jgi:hypothetical protein
VVLESLSDLEDMSGSKHMNGTLEWDEDLQLATLRYDTAIKNWQDIEVNDTLLSVGIIGEATDEYHIEWETVETFQNGFVFHIEFDNPSEIGLFNSPDYVQVTFRNNVTVRGIGQEYISSNTISVPIDRLMTNYDYDLAFFIGEVLFYAVILIFLVNAAMKFWIGASMRHSLKLLQLLQINELLPLFNVKLPSFLLVF